MKLIVQNGPIVRHWTHHRLTWFKLDHDPTAG